MEKLTRQVNFLLTSVLRYAIIQLTCEVNLQRKEVEARVENRV